MKGKVMIGLHDAAVRNMFGSFCKHQGYEPWYSKDLGELIKMAKSGESNRGIVDISYERSGALVIEPILEVRDALGERYKTGEAKLLVVSGTPELVGMATAAGFEAEGKPTDLKRVLKFLG